MTTYIVLWEYVTGPEDSEPQGATSYFEQARIEANNAEQACRRVVESNDLAPALVEEVENGGVTLIAVPFRNWTSGRHTLKAETTRRIRST